MNPEIRAQEVTMISKALADKLQSGSMIRKMFDEGIRLKAIHGAENVFEIGRASCRETV